jgi:hypothetical protein
MARLRVRIELNRRMTGVPLHKMVSVVEETHKFFHLLSEDVHIDADRGEWVASDFDAESLNFTAEYAGPVSAEQVQAFGNAFAGATSLRKTTIAQFTRIADFLGEDELVGFGLYRSDQEPEPSEWRCLSKRDAMRFGEEIRLLAQAAGEQLSETQLPAVLPKVMNASVAGRRLFKDRREREALASDPSKVVRELESNLSRRIGVLEEEVAEQTRKMRSISGNPDLAEERFQKLLAAMETFWAQAPSSLRQLPAAATSGVSQAMPAAEGPGISQAPVSDRTPVSQSPHASQGPAGFQSPHLAEEPAGSQSPADPAQNPAPAVNGHAPNSTAEPSEPKAAAKSRGWSASGAAVAALLAVLAGLAFPEMQHQWTRFAHVERLPLQKPKAPGAPVLPAAPAPEKPVAHTAAWPAAIRPAAVRPAAVRPAAVPPAAVRPLATPPVKDVAAQSPEPFEGPLVPLDIPSKIKSKIQSEVRVDVVVAIDREGSVTSARVSSTQGPSARLLVTEALRAAKQSRFRPAREGEKTVPSEMVLTFLFKPDSNDF